MCGRLILPAFDCRCSYVAILGFAVGEASADAFGFYLGAQWIWASVGYSWFWLCLCSGLGVLALNVTNPPSPRPTGWH